VQEDVVAVELCAALAVPVARLAADSFYKGLKRYKLVWYEIYEHALEPNPGGETTVYLPEQWGGAQLLCRTATGTGNTRLGSHSDREK